MTKVFLSYGGRTGQRLATRLRTAIEAILNFDDRTPSVECFVAERDVAAGDRWYLALDALLEECDFGVFILDRGYEHSIWMPYELREFVHKPDKPIFPLLFDIAVKNLVGPFSLHQSYDFDDESFRDLIDRIAGGATATQRDRFDERWSSLKRDITDTLERFEGEGGAPDLAQQLRRISDDMRPTGQNVALAAGYLADVVPNEEAFAALGELAKNIVEAHARSREGGRWGDIWKHYADRFLADAVVSTGRIAHDGEITLKHPDEAKDFWREQIMGHTEQSLWTTNLPGTFGRKTDPELLQAQRQAIGNGLKITRLFVYDPEDARDCREVRDAAQRQLEAGVEVWCMREGAFNWYETDLHTEIGDRDFMILDDRYVYVTQTRRYGVSRVIFRDSARALDAAKRLRDRLMPYAEKVRPASDGRIDIPPGWADGEVEAG